MTGTGSSGKLKIGIQFFAKKGLENQTDNQLKAGIRSLQKRIEEHRTKIRDPQSIYSNWESFTDEYKNGLIRHWEKDIRDFEESIKNRLDELEKREKE